MQPHFDTTEEDAMITVDTKAGLEVFAEHVDQLREEIEVLQAEYFSRYQTIAPEFYTAGESYQRLRSLVLAALDQLFGSDQVSDELVDELQASYNELSATRDAMSLLYSVGEEVSEVIDEVEQEEDAKEILIATEPEVETQGIISPFYTVPNETVSTSDIKPPSPQRNFASHAKRSESLFAQKRGLETRALELVSPEILANPKYQKVIEHYFGSGALFEASLLREIEKRELPSRLDNFLGVNHNSAFHTFLKDLPLSEIAMLEEESFEVMKERVTVLQIEYGIYIEWMNDLPVMHHLVRPHAAMTFSELYVRAELEILWQQFSRD